MIFAALVVLGLALYGYVQIARSTKKRNARDIRAIEKQIAKAKAASEQYNATPPTNEPQEKQDP